MAFESNFVSFIGNLTADPELRFTGGGAAVCSMRMAVNRTWKDRDGNQQEETSFISVNAWRNLAENIGESLHKGDRIIVLGRLRIRSYDDKEGVTKWVTEVEADEVAPSLRWARVEVNKVLAKSEAGAREDFGGVPPPSDEDVPF